MLHRCHPGARLPTGVQVVVYLVARLSQAFEYGATTIFEPVCHCGLSFGTRSTYPSGWMWETAFG